MSSSIIARKKVGGGKTAPKKELLSDRYLMVAANRAEKDLNTAAPHPLLAKASEDLGPRDEAFLRDMAETLFLFGGIKADDLDFMFEPKPDGSRVKGLDRVVRSLLEAFTAEGQMARSPTLIDTIVKDFRLLGIVGERNLALAVYLVGTSRLLAEPLSAIVQGHSSVGKSHVVTTISRLFPQEIVLDAMRISPQALYYFKGGLSHKFVVAGERSRVQDDCAAEVTAALRQLQSEGRITKLVTEKKEGEFTSTWIEQKGPIAYVETTTLDPKRIFPEDLNRALLLKTDDSEGQTRAILEYKASQCDGDGETADARAIIDKHREFQSALRSYEVHIPFAKELSRKIPAHKVEARRVGPQILSVIKAVTLLHQAQRQKDSKGRLIATLDDYEVAKSVLVQPLGETLGVSDSPTRFFSKLAAAFSGEKKFTTKDAQGVDLKASTSSVKLWLKELARHGCVEQVAKAVGPKPAVWRLCDTRPEQIVLPQITADKRGL